MSAAANIDVSVQGPIRSLLPPYGAPPDQELDAHGYVCEEYQLGGTAVSYRHGGDADPPIDGRCLAEPVAEAPYRTRILVVRPRDPARFNGTVLLGWQNVSAGFEQPAPAGGEVYRGYAWVGVSAQEVGLYGMPMGQRRSSRGQPLIDADPERYADLEHPGESGCFEIFAGAAVAVGPHRSGTDPLAGLPVERVVAMGGSQSAMRLCAHANAIHQVHPVIDGYLLSVWEGRAPRLEEGPLSMYRPTAIRSDLKVPVLVVNSEFEVMATHDIALKDHERRRVWEVTGTGHGAVPARGSGSDGWTPNPLSWRPVHEAAIRAMHQWLSEGTPPSIRPRIVIDDDPMPKICRDDAGNGVGGIRLPEIAVPVAEHRGRKRGTGRGALYGGRRPHPDAVVRERYRDRDDYLTRWRRVVEELVAAGILLSEDAPAMLVRGEAVAAELPLD